jgi:UDP-N-acetylmuramate dehydrogenase
MLEKLIKKNISLKDKNWFETGGVAEFFSEPTTENEIKILIDFALKNELKITILGSGANILINDEGVKGLVIKPNLKNISILDYKDNDYKLVKADSGVLIDNLINYSLDNNLIGLEEFSGIPGSVGGAIYINIHYFNFLIGDFLESAIVCDLFNGNIFEVDNNWFNFKYDNSKLVSKRYLLVSAIFKLKKCTDLESSFAKGRSVEIIRHRKSRYPYNGTCGCFFKNFEETEKNILEINGKKITSAGYYLDQVGVKGLLKVNNAGVSSKHANMIVNFGNATSNDILETAKTMKELVNKKFGLLLEPECQFMGFDKNPLI